MIFSGITPRTIFGRIFAGIALVSLLALAFFYYWFSYKFYDSLNREAEERLKNMAQTLAENIKNLEAGAPNSDSLAAFTSLWKFEERGAWLQNLYWLDVSQPKPAFIASFSAQNPQKISIMPPTAEEIEDLVFANINELERGTIVMPDPFTVADSRRYKIVLFPLLDQYQMLESVIGIEADLEYLRQASSLKRFFGEILLASLGLSLLVAFIIAGNISHKFAFILDEIKSLEKLQHSPEVDLNLVELNSIHRALTRMAREIMRKDQHLKEVFSRKLEELSFTGAAVAHEIRNPLSAIEMHFGLLKRKLTVSSQDNEQVREIDEQLAHLRKLVESFLHYSRLVKPEKQRIALRQFFEELVDSACHLWPGLVCDLHIDAGDFILFDPTMLRQICENIMANAVAASENGKIELRVTYQAKEHGWKLVLANNGPEIPSDLLEQLFTPFASGRPGGNGIGLALVRKLVEANDGEIFCENQQTGVAFTIEVDE